MNPLRVMIVADDLLVRTGLAALLESQADVRLVGQAHPARFADDAEMFQPDVVVWDLGWQSTTPLSASHFNWPLLLLVGRVERLRLPLSDATAFALLPRDSAPPSLLLALQALAQGLTVIAPSLLPLLINASAPSASVTEALTPREHEVLQLLAQGMTNKAIAHRLSITEHTVKFHVNAIMGKLDAQSRTDAVIRATRAGLVSL
ncbi:response regulator transcription factor [Aggregatilineales bacterium SYSU G02658]